MAAIYVDLSVVDLKSLVRAQDSKAIPYHPALVEGPTQPMVVTGPARVRTPFGQRTASKHLQVYGGTEAIDWVMNCVRLITETAANAEYHFEKKGVKYIHPEDRKPDTPEEVKDAPRMLAELFKSPNPYMGYEELIELTLIDFLLTGNAYWLKWRTNDVGQPLALYRLAPPLIEVVPGKWGIEKYVYKVPGTGKLEVSPDKIMHFKAPNPHDPYYGLGVIQGGARPLDLELALTDTQANYYEKKAQPSMVVQSERRVPQDVFGRLQNQLRQLYGGPRNAGALMVLEAGLKYQSISPSAADAQFGQLGENSRDRILAMFRVPGSLLGISNSIGDKPTDDQRVFDNKTMRPLLNKLQNAISRDITKTWEDLLFKIEYEYVMPPEDRIRLASTFAALPGVKVREVRAYANLDPLGDERDDWVLNMPGEDGTADNTHAGFPDNSQVNEAGRPPKSSNTVKFPDTGSTSVKPGAAVSLAAARRVGKSMNDILAGFDEAERKAVEPARHDMDSRIKPPDDLKLQREAAVDSVANSLERDLRAAINDLESALFIELRNAVDGKAPGDRIRSRLRNSEAWKTFMSTMSAALEKAAKSAISSAVIQQATQGRIADEELDYDSMAKEIVYRSGGARKITANLKDDLARKVAKTLSEGGSRQDLEAAIREQMDFWQQSHAMTVALTEATHAYNEGTLTVAELSGYTHVHVFDGEDDDEPCIEANNAVWDIPTARKNRLQHPRCRRAFTPISVPLEEVT